MSFEKIILNPNRDGEIKPLKLDFITKLLESKLIEEYNFLELVEYKKNKIPVAVLYLTYKENNNLKYYGNLSDFDIEDFNKSSNFIYKLLTKNNFNFFDKIKIDRNNISYLEYMIESLSVDNLNDLVKNNTDNVKSLLEEVNDNSNIFPSNLARLKKNSKEYLEILLKYNCIDLNDKNKNYLYNCLNWSSAKTLIELGADPLLIGNNNENIMSKLKDWNLQPKELTNFKNIISKSNKNINTDDEKINSSINDLFVFLNKGSIPLKTFINTFDSFYQKEGCKTMVSFNNVTIIEQLNNFSKQRSVSKSENMIFKLLFNLIDELNKKYTLDDIYNILGFNNKASSKNITNEEDLFYNIILRSKVDNNIPRNYNVENFLNNFNKFNLENYLKEIKILKEKNNYMDISYYFYESYGTSSIFKNFLKKLEQINDSERLILLDFLNKELLSKYSAKNIEYRDNYIFKECFYKININNLNENEKKEYLKLKEVVVLNEDIKNLPKHYDFIDTMSEENKVLFYKKINDALNNKYISENNRNIIARILINCEIKSDTEIDLENKRSKNKRKI